MIGEARQSGRPGDKKQCKIVGSRSMREEKLYTTRDARQCGRPTGKTHAHMEAGRCRKPYCVRIRKPQQIGKPGALYVVG